MDEAAFEQVYGAFGDFHAYFAPLFGRRETRDHRRHYLQSLLVQSGERRNAENLSETIPALARVMQRFLTESPWDDAVIGRLQEYLGPRLGPPPRRCGCWTAATSPSRAGVRGSGPSVLRETGQGGQLPGRNVPGLRQPVGARLGGQAKRLYLPESWTSDKDRCASAVVPEERRDYHSKTELAREMLQRALARGLRDVAVLP